LPLSATAKNLAEYGRRSRMKCCLRSADGENFGGYGDLIITLSPIIIAQFHINFLNDFGEVGAVES
jgi:hypothetical protein